MNPIQSLEEAIKSEFPDATCHIDQPHPRVAETGIWHLDIWLDENKVNVAGDPRGTIGVSDLTKESFFGEGPDELFPDEAQAFARIRELLQPKQPA